MRDKKHIALAAAALALLLAVPAGCGQEEPAAEPEPAFEDIYTGSVSLVPRRRWCGRRRCPKAAGSPSYR